MLNSTLKSSGIDSSRTLTTDSLSIWLQRAVQISSSPEKSPIDFGKVVSDEDAQSIFNFVCDFWTDSGVAFGNALKELFVKIISLISATRPSDSLVIYLHKWTLHILKFSRDQRVLYFMLEILAKKVGGTFILENSPQFLSQALSYMGSNALANPIGKALFSIFSTILTEWTGESKNNASCDLEVAQKWTKLWAEPTRQALLNEKTREHVQTYFLPQMFKRLPQSLKLFIEPMTDINFNTPENEISVLLGCMKLGQERGILDVLDEGSNVITEEFLESLLHHESPVLRVSALALAATSQQMTKPVANYVFKVLERSLDDFFIESDPGFRNQFYGFIRQFIFRVRASSYSIKKESEKSRKKGEIERSDKLLKEVDFIQQFFSWLVSYLERCLRPSAPYQFRYTSMLLVQLLANSGLDDEIRPECYEKQHDWFPFKLPVYNKNIVRLLIDNIANNYEDVRATASKILKIAKLPIPHIESYDQIDELVFQSLDTISGMRGREGDAGARGLELAFNLYFNFPVPKDNPNANIEKGLDLFEKVLSNLEDEINFSNRNLAIAVREHPIHGYFTALGFILESVDFFKFASNDKSQIHWSRLIARMVNCVENVWANVKDILCHDSPEGNMPKEFEFNYQPELEEKYGPANQVILSYSWRAVKESTAMLKVLLDRVPLKDQKGPGKSGIVIENTILPNSVVVSIGDLLLTQLATVRHRGAFSSIYPTFIACCKRCNRTSELKEQPENWLSENINLIKIKAQYITRRSGGLPFLITAVLTAEINPNMDLITKTFEKLITIAKSPAIPNSEEKMDLPQVHAFNCIKALFVETNLSNRSAYFIEPALELAIVSFSSDIWAIRNCAVMLFTALQNRLFGTAKPTKSKHSVSTTSAKIFFNKYKSIRGTLLTMLVSYVENIDKTSSQVQTVFPVLSLLSRLESTVGYTGLEDFKPLIIACLGSKIWKVREMAARVIPPLLRDQDTIKFLEELINSSSLADQNKLHGVFLAGLNIVISRYELFQEQERLRMAGITENSEISNCKISQNNWIAPEFISFIFSRFDEFVIYNPSAETATGYIRILKEIYSSFLTEESEKTIPEFETILIPRCKQLWNNQKTDGLSSSRRVLESEMAEIILIYAFSPKNQQNIDESLILVKDMILSIENYEVQLMALEFLDTHVEFLTGGNSEVILKGLWDIFDSRVWDQVRGPAARLFSKIFSKFSKSSSSLSFRQDVVKYWDVLFNSISSKNTEEINESCLEALGIFTGQLFNSSEKDASLKVSQWIKLISQFSDENEAYPSREAALNSLLSFLSTASHPTGKNILETTPPSNYQLTLYIDAIFQLFSFLSDDDEDIRITAAEYVSRMLELRFLATSAYCEKKLLFNFLVDEFPSQFEKKFAEQSDVVCNHISNSLFEYITEDGTQAIDLLKKALTVDDTLFIYEKQNLFRDEVIKYEQVGKAFKLLKKLRQGRLVCSDETIQKIENWVTASVPALEDSLKSLGGDKNILQWAKDPKVVQEGSRICVVADIYLTLSESSTNNDALKEQIASLKKTDSIKAMLVDL